MKLIIDIPDEDYEWINKLIAQEITDRRTSIRLYKAIAHGIPLDDIKADLSEEVKVYDTEFGKGYLAGILTAQEVIDNHIGGAE